MNNKLFIGDNLSIMRSLPYESVDLIATDPPFMSQRNYGEFNDKWSSIKEFIEFMKLRLIEMYRLLKPTGSIYLHLDQSSSHYMKMEMDQIFHVNNFQNDIIWSYNSGGGTIRRFGRKHDNILFYSKTDNHIFHADNVRVPYPHDYGDKIPTNPKGKVASDVIININRLSNSAKERNGYPTQKPVKLYKWLINASSNEGDLVLDPFVGSGTSLDAAQSLNRNWIGIDQNPNTISYIKKRFDKYGLLQPKYEVIHAN